jgi:hypothetical protein
MSPKNLILSILIFVFLAVIGVFVFFQFGVAKNVQLPSDSNSNIISNSSTILGFPQDKISNEIKKQVEAVKDLPDSITSAANNVQKNRPNSKSDQKSDQKIDSVEKTKDEKSVSSSSITTTSVANSKSVNQERLEKLEKLKVTTFDSGTKLVRVINPSDIATIEPRFELGKIDTNQPQLYLVQNNQIILPAPNTKGIYEFKDKNETKYFWFNTFDSGDFGIYVSDKNFTTKIEIKPKIRGFVSEIKVDNRNLNKIKITNYPGDGAINSDFKQETIDFDLIKYMNPEE